MTAIPGEQVVSGNGGGNGQVHGVASGFGRQATCGEEKAGQFLGVGADLGAAGKTRELAATMQRLAALGLEVQITELDVALDLPCDAKKLERQAQIYGEITSVAMREEACTALLMWGFTDKYSWLPLFSNGKRGCGLIFDDHYQPKPAYTAMLNAMIAR